LCRILERGIVAPAMLLARRPANQQADQNKPTRTNRSEEA
jgi:hypothetical protein